MSTQHSHRFSINASIDDFDDRDGIFRSPNDLRSVGSSRNFRSPSLPVSLARRSWFNFLGYFQPGESEYDSSFRRHKQRSRFLLILFSGLTLTAVLVTVLYEGGEEVAAAISAVVPHQAYVVAQKTSIPEIQAEMVLYRHTATQAEVLTIIPSDLDQDSVFGLSVKTLAENNKGAAHVLMHSIWDGSRMYPLKDQVHTYHKGSLATLVEATCLEDRTLYTVASRNRKDFNNLMSLVLDALFQPLVRLDQYGDVIFREEGWRLDPIDGKNFNASNDDLKFNGQTFNLQKATYNDVDEMITRFARRALFGDTHYQFDAQGVPTDIIDLRKVDVTNFYDQHYVATNTQVFVYGSVESVQDALQAFDDSTQDRKAHLDIMEHSLPQWQPFNLKEAAEEIHAYPIEQGDNIQSHTVVSWLLNDSHMSHKTQLAWLVLEYLLVGTPISILRRSLEEYVQTDVENVTLSTEVIGGAGYQLPAMEIQCRDQGYCARSSSDPAKSH
ncbi:Peptidase M16C associated [Fragilaria crotonensis]|nr:Peptidase M16C associated [Fragilaria crotonensis]